MIDIGKGETIRIQTFSKPTEELVSAAARLGLQAWRAQIPESVRSDEELAHMFDPERIQRSMDRAAKDRFSRFAGAIAIAHDGETAGQAGVIWGKDEVSGSFMQKAQKRLLVPPKNYTAITQLSVPEPYQGRGVGTELVRAFVSEFDPRHRTTAYVFAENDSVLATASAFGFEPDPAEPTVVEDQYFGAGSSVQQYRLVTPSNQALLDRLPPIPVAQ